MQRNHKIQKIPLTHVERMQNQIMPKQSARATKEETRKKDQIKNGGNAQGGFKYKGNMQQVGNGHTSSGMEKDCTGSLRSQRTVMFNEVEEGKDEDRSQAILCTKRCQVTSQQMLISYVSVTNNKAQHHDLMPPDWTGELPYQHRLFTTWNLLSSLDPLILSLS